MIDVPLNWSDNYVGKKWTREHNCLYWADHILQDLTLYKLDVVTNPDEYQTAKLLLQQEKQDWCTIPKPSRHFDIVLMRHTGTSKWAHHIGLWTEARGGAVVHAVEKGYIDVDTVRELSYRGFEIKRVMRHKNDRND